MLEGHPAIKNFFLYDRKIKKLPLFTRLWKEAKLLWQIRKAGYDLVVNLTEGDRGALVAFFSKSRFRAGFDPQNKGFRGKRSIYTHMAKTPNGQRHTVERQLDFLRRIGIFPETDEKELTFHVPTAAREKMQKCLQEHGIKEGNFFRFTPFQDGVSNVLRLALPLR